MDYDIALSFAGEDRKYVEEVATELKRLGVRVFYDNFETVNLWGKDLYTHLQKIYQEQAKYTVIFISKHYAKKHWTNHERKMAQARAFTESIEYILPVRFDDTEIEGITKTVGYIDLRRVSPSELSALICQKIGIYSSKIDAEPLSAEKLSQNESQITCIYEESDKHGWELDQWTLWVDDEISVTVSKHIQSKSIYVAEGSHFLRVLYVDFRPAVRGTRHTVGHDAKYADGKTDVLQVNFEKGHYLFRLYTIIKPEERFWKSLVNSVFNSHPWTYEIRYTKVG
jgi:hypothetical protein